MKSAKRLNRKLIRQTKKRNQRTQLGGKRTTFTLKFIGNSAETTADISISDSNTIDAVPGILPEEYARLVKNEADFITKVTPEKNRYKGFAILLIGKRNDEFTFTIITHDPKNLFKNIKPVDNIVDITNYTEDATLCINHAILVKPDEIITPEFYEVESTIKRRQRAIKGPSKVQEIKGYSRTNTNEPTHVYLEMNDNSVKSPKKRRSSELTASELHQQLIDEGVYKKVVPKSKRKSSESDKVITTSPVYSEIMKPDTGRRESSTKISTLEAVPTYKVAELQHAAPGEKIPVPLPRSKRSPPNK